MSKLTTKIKRVKFIYNPSSGETHIAEKLDEIINLYQREGYTMSLYRLGFGSNQEQQILSDLDNYHHILIAGGDGTINYVVNLLKKNNYDTPIAILPSGTANDFASMLGISSDIIEACQGLLAGRIKKIDLGKVNNDYFINVFSCGLFTEISQKTPTILKNTFGKLAYYVGGLGELAKIRKMNIRIESDGGNFEGSSLIFFVFNGKTAGNMKIAYLSKADDGLLDVLIVKGDSPLEVVNSIFHYFTLHRYKKYPQGVVHIRCSRLSAFSEISEGTDIDGQPGPEFPLNIECIKGGLRILTPRRRAPRLTIPSLKTTINELRTNY